MKKSWNGDFHMGYVRVQPPKDYADLSPGQRMAFWREAVLDAVADQHAEEAVAEAAADGTPGSADPDMKRAPAAA